MVQNFAYLPRPQGKERKYPRKWNDCHTLFFLIKFPVIGNIYCSVAQGLREMWGTEKVNSVHYVDGYAVTLLKQKKVLDFL